jgi:hypothetical protein
MRTYKYLQYTIGNVSGLRAGAKLAATAALLLTWAFSARAQEEEIVIPEPLDFVNVIDATTLDTIGVTALRNINSNLNGSGVNVAQPEALDQNIANKFQVRPSYVGQPQIFTYTNRTGQMSNVWPNNVGTESEHADIVGAIFYGQTNTVNQEGVAYGVNHIDNYEVNRFYEWYIAGSHSS